MAIHNAATAIVPAPGIRDTYVKTYCFPKATHRRSQLHELKGCSEADSDSGLASGVAFDVRRMRKQFANGVHVTTNPANRSHHDPNGRAARAVCLLREHVAAADRVATNEPACGRYHWRRWIRQRQCRSDSIPRPDRS